MSTRKTPTLVLELMAASKMLERAARELDAMSTDLSALRAREARQATRKQREFAIRVEKNAKKRKGDAA